MHGFKVEELTEVTLLQLSFIKVSPGKHSKHELGLLHFLHCEILQS